MTSDYATALRALLARSSPQLEDSHRVEFKRCFGAVAAYVDGAIFASCGKFGVALKLPADTLGNLFGEADVLPLRYFAKGHVKREYAVIPERITRDSVRFTGLVDNSVAYALRTAPR